METAARVALRSSCQSSVELSESGAAEGEVRVAGRLVDCFATTAGMQREFDDSSFWTVRGRSWCRGDDAAALRQDFEGQAVGH